ncbi:Signal transduction histidine kinase CheA [hydrothermal vent metagenome]|uniref:histidine kinase n=1 Tax=hydrothermal vent metagenome TaxID=652676 RepID=A0A3B0VQT4_9ZZZZ
MEGMEGMEGMEEIVQDFIVESSEALDTLEQKFLELEESPEDSELLNDVFRTIHTVKGAAGFLAFEQTVEVAHITEDILNRLRKGDMKLSSDIMDAILQSVDMLKLLLKSIEENMKEDKMDVVPVVSRLRELLDVSVAGGATAAPKPAAPVEEPAASEPAVPAEEPAAPTSSAPTEEPAAPKPAAAAPEKTPAPADTSAAKKAPAKDKEYNIRVDISRLDAVMDLVGELVLARNRLDRIDSRMIEEDHENELVMQLDEAVGQLSLATSDLQLAVMKMRMQPVSKVFNKFPRMVRDLAKTNGKVIDLVIKGEQTEVDKSVIEEIADPLVHIIRNSVDHGIESIDERLGGGKPGKGTITLMAYQEGRNIYITIEDDGKGIDPEAIKASALKKGLITEADVKKFTDREAWDLIFMPGFSTAAQVTDISGRGVGMDVVRTNIMRINGTVLVDSKVGKGTKITFRLPLTLAIINALNVESSGELYAIPLTTVMENMRVHKDQIKMINGKKMVNIRDSVLPVVNLDDLVGTGCSEKEEGEWMYLVIVEIGDRRFGMLVDKLHGQEEIVMKSMGEYLKGTAGIAGACVTGDGKVILILDMGGLVEVMKTKHSIEGDPVRS